jgi:hypothetical protein
MKSINVYGTATAIFAFCASTYADRQRNDPGTGARDASVRSIAPVYSQLLATRIPNGFKVAHEAAKGDLHIQELVPVDESLEMAEGARLQQRCATHLIPARAWVGGWRGEFRKMYPIPSLEKEHRP